MVRVVDMHEAKTQLSKVVDEEFIIARDGNPVARVTPRQVQQVGAGAGHLGIRRRAARRSTEPPTGKSGPGTLRTVQSTSRRPRSARAGVTVREVLALA